MSADRDGAAESLRKPLSRQAILEAGLRIAKREDLGQLTIRKLAEVFGVTPMAIYRHFENKADIVDGVLDLFIHEAAVTDHDVDPAEAEAWLTATFRAMHDALLAAPGVLPLLGTSYSLGPGGLAVLEQVLGVLKAAGLAPERCAEVYLVLTSYMIGFVTMEVAFGREASREGEARSDRERHSRFEFDARSDGDFPSIVEMAPHFARAREPASFERGLLRIYRGLKNADR